MTTTIRWLAGVFLCFVPMIAVYLSPWSDDGALEYLGILPTLVALPSGVLVGAVIAIITPVVVFIGLLLSGTAVGVLKAHMLRP